jgi:hypothetical protein
MSEPTLARNLLEFAKQRFRTLDLLSDYLRAVIAQWNDIFFLSIPALPFVAWWYLGDPPMSIRIGVFLWILVVAGYYAWRTEHLKVVAQHFKSWISDTAIVEGRAFIGLRIVNVGPPTSIHTWQAGFERSDGGHNYLSDRMLVEDENLAAPNNIRGKNLRRDYRLLETGETREGWIAFDVGPVSNDDAVRVLKTVSLIFTDAFDNHHEISTMPPWVRKLERSGGRGY